MLGNRSRSVTGSRMRLFRTYKITGSLLKELPGCTSPRASVFQDRALHEHRRPSSLPSHTSFKVACFSSFGMAPVLVPLRPSNEHILIVRVPGARDRRGCHSTPSSCAFCEQEGWSGGSLPTLHRPRVARAQETSRPLASRLAPSLYSAA